MRDAAIVGNGDLAISTIGGSLASISGRMTLRLY
jgi:hypothetical protein